jgi:hypothetical protein
VLGAAFRREINVTHVRRNGAIRRRREQAMSEREFFEKIAPNIDFYQKVSLS